MAPCQLQVDTHAYGAILDLRAYEAAVFLFGAADSAHHCSRQEAAALGKTSARVRASTHAAALRASLRLLEHIPDWLRAHLSTKAAAAKCHACNCLHKSRCHVPRPCQAIVICAWVELQPCGQCLQHMSVDVVCTDCRLLYEALRHGLQAHTGTIVLKNVHSTHAACPSMPTASIQQLSFKT